jgi:hypothetical protein
MRLGNTLRKSGLSALGSAEKLGQDRYATFDNGTSRLFLISFLVS